MEIIQSEYGQVKVKRVEKNSIIQWRRRRYVFRRTLSRQYKYHMEDEIECVYCMNMKR